MASVPTPGALVESPLPSFAAHREPTLFYAPPYDRTVEDEFAWHLVKYLDPACGLLVQHRCVTPAGPAWVDFVVEAIGPGGLVRRTGIEITSAQEEKDDTLPMRDAMLVGTGALDALYRVNESAVLHRLHDVYAVLAAAEPHLFNERAHHAFDRLAAKEAAGITVAPADTDLVVPDTERGEDDPFAGIGDEGFTVHRLVGREPLTWLHHYTRALDALGSLPKEVRHAA